MTKLLSVQEQPPLPPPETHPMTARVLSAVQENIYVFIAQFLEQNDGLCPSFIEIGSRFRLSTSQVEHHLLQLEIKGWIARSHTHHRTITLLGTDPETTTANLLSLLQGGRFVLASEIQPKQRATPVLKVMDNFYSADHICKGDYLVTTITSSCQHGEVIALGHLNEPVRLQRISYTEPDCINLCSLDSRQLALTVPLDCWRHEWRVLAVVTSIIRHMQ